MRLRKEVIKHLCLKNAMSYSDLAREAGISRMALYNGYMRTGIRTAGRLARALSCDVYDIIEDVSVEEQALGE